jgi:hypothetical protein
VVHCDEQKIVKSAEFTRPLPLTVTAIDGTTGAVAEKFAVTVRGAFIVTVQRPVPLHAPLQPKKYWPAAGVAVSVALVPVRNWPLQIVPQAITEGELVTVPVPVPVRITESVWYE